MDVFKNTNAAPFQPRKTPYKATTIRIPKNDQLLAREPRGTGLCTVCDKTGHLICSACHLMRYCSVDCQRLDHGTHKFFCKSFGRFTDDKRPSPQHIRAILFAEDKIKPEWTWVLRNDDRTAFSLSHMYENLPTDGLTKMTQVMYMSCTIKRVAQHWLFSLCLEQSSNGEEYSSINQSVEHLGPPRHLMTYWGPILVVGGMPEMAPSAQHPEYPMINRLEDVSMNDTSFVIEAVLYGDHNSPCVVNVPRYPYRSLVGLKVNCLGDQNKLILRSNIDPWKNIAATEAAIIYETVTVPNKEELSFSRQYPCILPFLLGLPWLCRRVFNFSDLEDQQRRRSPWLPSLLSNTFLGKVHCSLKQHGSQLLGYRVPEVGPKQPANIEEVQPPGTLILVHVFGEPIRREHLKVFNMFARAAKLDYWWEPGFGYKTFNRDLFRKFWDDKKRSNDIPGVDLTDVDSPYAWMDKPRQEEKYVEGFAQHEDLLARTVTDVYFDNVYRGGRRNPWAGGTRNYQEYFDPLN